MKTFRSAPVIPLRFAAVISLSLATHAAAALAEPVLAESPILNFQVIQADMYRGGRPEQAGLEYLKALGVRTIINLENDDQAVEQEQRNAAALGIRMLSFPLSGIFSSGKENVEAALSALQDRSLYPVYIHCAHGRDRTGSVVGIYRVEVNGWEPARAYAEMKLYGFRKVRYALYRYFKKRVGL